MFTRFQRFYNSIKLVTDLLTIAVSFAVAWWLRFEFFEHESVPPLRESLETLALSLVIFPVIFRGSNLYTTNRGRSHIQEVFEVFKATALSTLVLVGVSYFIRERYSRLTIVLFAGSAFVLLSLVRLSFRAIFNELRRRGVNVKTILVVGAGQLGQRVVETIEQHRELGFKVTGLLTRKPEKVGTLVSHVPVVGLFGDLSRALDEHQPDQVILALPLEEQPQLRELMEVLALRTVDVKVVPDLFNYVTLRGGLEEFGGLPIISLQGAPLEGWNRIAKRVFDLLLSALALLFLSPVMLIVAVLVKLTSRGPVLYAQERMGIDGQLFHMYKFRTMKVDAERAGAQFATADDPRRTPIGTFLRRFSFDELPQFWNVLTGDMSLVGPRPERPVFIEEFKKQIPRYHLRHMVKSGITGWAQVNGLRGNTSIKDRIDYDLYYIENWSMLFDLKILVRTALGGFLSKNAY
ncbi:MAG: undecaprenyl-phosphate glucose phosphotransferase [Myxococcaceae bacterium]